MCFDQSARVAMATWFWGLNPKTEKNLANHLPGRKSRVGGRDRAQSILTFARILAESRTFGRILHFLGGCQKPVTLLWVFICSAPVHGVFTSPNQEIYWLTALLAFDEPIKTLRGFVKCEARRYNRKCILYVHKNTFAARKKKWFCGSMDNHRITLG